MTEKVFVPCLLMKTSNLENHSLALCVTHHHCSSHKPSFTNATLSSLPIFLHQKGTLGNIFSRSTLKKFSGSKHQVRVFYFDANREKQFILKIEISCEETLKIKRVLY